MDTTDNDDTLREIYKNLPLRTSDSRIINVGDIIYPKVGYFTEPCKVVEIFDCDNYRDFNAEYVNDNLDFGIMNIKRINCEACECLADIHVMGYFGVHEGTDSIGEKHIHRSHFFNVHKAMNIETWILLQGEFDLYDDWYFGVLGDKSTWKKVDRSEVCAEIYKLVFGEDDSGE
jgi:hypothetical protein